MYYMDRGLGAMMLWSLTIHLCLFAMCQGQAETPADCTVSINGSVSIFCNRNTTATEISYELTRNGQLLHVVNNLNRSQFEMVFSTGEVSQFGHTLDQGPSFEISRLNHNSSGVYVCKATVIFPPPLYHTENSTTVVYIEHTCPSVGPVCKETEPPQCPPFSLHTHTPLLVVLGLVTIYGLLLTPITFKLWRTSRKSQFEDHDYINMRLFGRRKYNGVQHPVYPGNRKGFNISMEVHEDNNHFGPGKLA